MRISYWSSDVCSSDLALGVLDLEVFAGLAAGFERHQAAVAADAVVLVQDRRAFGQLAQVADDRFWLAPGAPAAERLRGALGEQLDRTSVVSGKSVSVRVDIGGCRIHKKTKIHKNI